IPAWRHRSLIGTPASPCLSTAMIWVSVNFDFFIQPPGGEKMPESFTYWVSTDRGSLRDDLHGNEDTDRCQYQLQHVRAGASEGFVADLDVRPVLQRPIPVPVALAASRFR